MGRDKQGHSTKVDTEDQFEEFKLFQRDNDGLKMVPKALYHSCTAWRPPILENEQCCELSSKNKCMQMQWKRSLQYTKRASHSWILTKP